MILVLGCVIDRKGILTNKIFWIFEKVQAVSNCQESSKDLNFRASDTTHINSGLRFLKQ